MTLKFLTLYMPSQASRSDNYIASMKDTLSIFRDFLREKKKYNETTFTFSMCDRDIIYEFLEYLKTTRHNKSSTLKTRLAELKSYIKYASEEDLAIQSTYLLIQSIKISKPTKEIKEILSPEECYCIFQQPPNTKRGTRDRTFLILLYESACRLSEILNLKISDLHLVEDDAYIVVNGKGKKQRIVLIGNTTIKHIGNYFSLYHNEDCPDTDLLFYSVISNTVKPLSPRTIQSFIKKYAALARKEMPSIPERVYTHMFRRSKATTYYNNGVGLEIIASILGHSKLETTREYALLSTKTKRAVIESVETPEQKNIPKKWKGKTLDLKNKYGLR